MAGDTMSRCPCSCAIARAGLPSRNRGASAVLLSEMAEDELCRIVSACQVLEV